MTFKRLSKRTLSVLLCALILLSTTLVGSISASATADWHVGSNAHLIFDNSNTNWTMSRWRMFVATEDKVYVYKATAMIGGKGASNAANGYSKSFYYGLTNTNGVSIHSNDIKFITFAKPANAYTNSGGALVNQNIELNFSDVFNSDNSIKTEAYGIGNNYTENYTGGFNDTTGKTNFLFKTSGSAPYSVSMETSGTDVDGLLRTVNVSSGAGGSVDYSGKAVTKYASDEASAAVSGTVSAGSSEGISITYSSKLDLTATPSSGNYFIGWYKNDTLVSKEATYSVRYYDNASVEARFSDTEETTTVPETDPSLVTQSVEVYTNGEETGEGGSVSATCGGSDIELPAAITSGTLTLTAQAETGYKFAGFFEGDTLLSSSTTYSYSVSGAKTIKAKFISVHKQDVKIYLNNSESDVCGTVSAACGGSAVSAPFNADYETTVSFTASANEGYTFDGWYDNDSFITKVESNSTCSYPASSDKTVYARFVPESYSQTVTVYTDDSVSGTGGTVSAVNNGAGATSPFNADAGSTVTLTAAPKSGYMFDGWYDGDTLLVSSEEYTYTVSKSNNISAKFISEVDYSTAGDMTMKIRPASMLYFDTTVNGWTASRVRIVLFTDDKAYARVLSNVTNASLAGRSAKNILAKLSVDIKDVKGISFVYLDSVSNSNSFKDGECTEYFNIATGVPTDSRITGYTAKYTTAISDSKQTYHIFRPATKTNAAEISLNSFGKGSSSPYNFPQNRQDISVYTKESGNEGSYIKSVDGGTVTISTALKKQSSEDLSNSFTGLANKDYDNSVKTTTSTYKDLGFSSAYAAKVVLTASVSDNTKYAFIGWYDDEGNQLEYTNKSNHLEYTYYPTEATTVCAHFAPIYEYEVTGGSTAKIVGFNYNTALNHTISIPSTLDGYTVTEISTGAFKDETDLHDVSVPSSVTVIRDKAFEGCKGLDQVTLNNKDVDLQGEVFLNTRVADDPIVLVADKDTTTVKNYADKYYYLYFLPIETVIGPDDFDYYIEDDEVRLVRYKGDVTIDRIVIPAEIDNKPVVGLGSKLFYQCKKAYYLYIPEYVSEIGKDAYPKYTTYYDVHTENTAFKSVVDPDYNYGSYTPDARSDLYSKDGKTFIRYAVGDGTRHKIKPEARKRYTVQDGVTTIAEGAFKNSSTHINSITLPSSVTTIRDEAFSYCLNLRTINIPSGVASIGDKAFMNCRSLESITTYGSLGDEIFSGCIKLNEINIKGSSSIGDYAFSGCHKLKYITDETDSITTVGANVIRECENLSEITSTNIVASIVSDSLIEESKRFITSNAKTCIVYEGAMRTDTADNNSFEISDSSYTNIGTLGVQKKDTDAIRFVTAINSKLLKDSNIKDYGYVMGKLEISSPDPDAVASIRERMDKVNNNNATKLSLKESDNKLSGDYGLYSANTNYKYVTAAVEDITDSNNILFARFYIETKDGDIIYSTYQTSVTETKQVKQYQTDEYGNQIYDENGNPVTEDIEETEIVRKKFNGCVLQSSNLL